ncbi:MAG: transposase [Rhodothermaceae bacterium]|nr:transposase [Rhodothermaceae bacterium]MYE63196.1 transposase [Rhodothermaceae bacterium]MYJ20402.1 transposase [Rhodothermaceae bacterium]
MTNHADFFQKPTHKAQRNYEALRAFHVDKLPGKKIAELFGISYGAFRNLCHEFSKNPNVSFFAPVSMETAPPEGSLRARILELRKTQQVSVYDIEELLKAEGLAATPSYIAKVLRKANLPRLPRRPQSPKPLIAPVADCRKLNLSSRNFSTCFGGLFLFASDLARMNIDALVDAFPGSKKLPAAHMIRSLLALKLWGIGRPSQVMSAPLDEGLALFAGLNAIPKKSTLSEYTARCDPRFTQTFTHAWFEAAAGLGANLEEGTSFDLDFHTIPYHGDQALMEKHYISKRSRRQLGILTFLARDASARLFSYADTTVHKEGHSLAIQSFIEDWKTRTGSLPTELVFDSGVTTYEQLSRLNQQGIQFITLRKRYPALVESVRAEPAKNWKSIQLNNIGRKYRRPRVLSQKVNLRRYEGEIRQIAVRGLGHDHIIFILTNQLKPCETTIIDRYARRMVIENVISDTIDFFHMDALSATVPMKIHVDVQLTVIASLLYRLFGLRVQERWDVAETRSIFRSLIPKRAKIQLTEKEIVVAYPRRAHNPLLIGGGYDKTEQPIPWLGNKILKIKFA